jgi:hypothetical protein
MSERSRWRQIPRSSALIVVMLAAMIPLGCVTPEAATQVAKAECDEPYEARCIDAKVWATWQQTDKLHLLPECGAGSSWEYLVPSCLVTVDEVGQAELRSLPYCSNLFLFQESSLVMSPCDRNSLGTWKCQAGAAAFAQCDVDIQTLSADVEVVGTWLSVIYLWESQLTLVIVGEGGVAVTPVHVLDFEVVDRDLMIFDVTARELGEPVPTSISIGEEPRFLYTAPDAKLEQLPDGLPSWQEWQGLEGLTALRQYLSETEPNLEPWLQRVWEQARGDDIPLPELVPLTRLVLVGSGELWDNELVQDAILHAVDWRSATESVFDQAAPVAVRRLDASGQEVTIREDASSIEHDPQRAQKLLEEAGIVQGMVVELRLSPDDESVIRMAELIKEHLAQVGILVQLTSTAGELPLVGIAPVPRAQLVLQLTRE